MSDKRKISLLCVGLCCHDVKGKGLILGGTASYCSLFAKTQDLEIQVLTSVGDDFEFYDRFFDAGIPIHNIVALRTTVFENIYAGAARMQYMHARAGDIALSDLPEEVMDNDIVLVGTIANEVNLSEVSLLNGSFTVGALQGSMRTWNEEGLIGATPLDYTILENFDLIILSEDDIAGLDRPIEQIRAQIEHLVITRGAKGASVYLNGKEFFYPSFPAREVDATGAGDLFTIAYLLEYYRTNDATQACIYAQCAASLIVEVVGNSEIPEEQVIRERMNAYRTAHG